MFRRLILFLLLLSFPIEGYAGVVKLGDAMNNKNRKLFKSEEKKSLYAGQEISCFENSDCPFDRECVALRCESVCKNVSCDEGTHCVPAGKDKPQEYKCAECATNKHCPPGLFCDKDYTCKRPDPCLKAVCSPAAPFCMPKPYKTLPYTCVQCLENEHCPPVAGLTRSCVDGYCLFNVEGNFPAGKTPPPVNQETPAEEEFEEVYEEEYED
ncbi:MAG: hypothetical protein J5787_01780 [Alphaproteobacteria bacterium]|nr:hypothetical protein [Alphaproteobacteria bacterium]